MVLRAHLSMLYAVIQVSSYINLLRGLCSGTSTVPPHAYPVRSGRHNTSMPPTLLGSAWDR